MAGSCRPYINNLYGWLTDQSASYYSVASVRLTARGSSGFTAFSMGPSYSPATGIANPSTPHPFYLTLNPASGKLEGKYQEVFPSRSDGSSDLTTLLIPRTGSVQLRIDDWGGVLVTLSQLECFPGETGRAFVMRGRSSTPGYGTDRWMFLVTPGLLD